MEVVMVEMEVAMVVTEEAMVVVLVLFAAMVMSVVPTLERAQPKETRDLEAVSRTISFLRMPLPKRPWRVWKNLRARSPLYGILSCFS